MLRSYVDKVLNLLSLIFVQFISIALITPLNRTFFKFASDGPAMSGHRRVLSRLFPIGISCKIPICAAVGEI